MTLLALETSCDETSAAVIRDGAILANVVSSQVRLHREYGGVVPELATREHLKSVYARSNDSPAALRHDKLLAIEELRQEYARIKQEDWGGYSGYDGWFKRPINNAQLNTIATYHRFVPSFRALLHNNAGDLQKFYRQVESFGKLPKKERHRRLLEEAQTTGHDEELGQSGKLAMTHAPVSTKP